MWRPNKAEYYNTRLRYADWFVPLGGDCEASRGGKRKWHILWIALVSLKRRC